MVKILITKIIDNKNYNNKNLDLFCNKLVNIDFYKNILD